MVGLPRHVLGELGLERARALIHVSADGAEWVHAVVVQRVPTWCTARALFASLHQCLLDLHRILIGLGVVRSLMPGVGSRSRLVGFL